MLMVKGSCVPLRVRFDKYMWQIPVRLFFIPFANDNYGGCSNSKKEVRHSGAFMRENPATCLNLYLLEESGVLKYFPPFFYSN